MTTFAMTSDTMYRIFMPRIGVSTTIINICLYIAYLTHRILNKLTTYISKAQDILESIISTLEEALDTPLSPASSDEHHELNSHHVWSTPERTDTSSHSYLPCRLSIIGDKVAHSFEVHLDAMVRESVIQELRDLEISRKIFEALLKTGESENETVSLITARLGLKEWESEESASPVFHVAEEDVPGF